MNLQKLEKFIDRQKVSIVASIDEAGFPNLKAQNLFPPKKCNFL